MRPRAATLPYRPAEALRRTPAAARGSGAGCTGRCCPESRAFRQEHRHPRGRTTLRVFGTCRSPRWPAEGSVRTMVGVVPGPRGTRRAPRLAALLPALRLQRLPRSEAGGEPASRSADVPPRAGERACQHPSDSVLGRRRLTATAGAATLARGAGAPWSAGAAPCWLIAGLRGLRLLRGRGHRGLLGRGRLPPSGMLTCLGPNLLHAGARFLPRRRCCPWSR
jgi:hypothetical protein